MSDFTSTSKFRVSMVNSDGSSDRVTVQIGLDGLKIIDADSGRTLRSYELNHISRWQSRPGNLILYTRTPVDVEERQVTLQGDEYTIRNALDMLTCSCMQLAELLQSKQGTEAQETANSLHALVAGDGKKPSKLPSADDVEYWKSPAMEGWLQSQGEHIKSWRKRWFVLKQGYLYRFMNSTVSESTKPRGVVDLSKIQDVSQAQKTTGRPFSFQLKTASGGSVCYLCENETELVLWMSAINREIEKIVKKLAGVEDEPAPKPSSKTHSSSHKSGSNSSSNQKGGHNEWIKQLERNFDNLNTSEGPSSRSHHSSSSHHKGSNGAAMIDVIGYETIGGGGGGGNSGRQSDRRGPGSSGAAYNSDAYGGSGIDYSQVAGATVVSADTLMNYGGARPAAAASTPSYSTAAQHTARANSYGAGNTNSSPYAQHGSGNAYGNNSSYGSNYPAGNYQAHGNAGGGYNSQQGLSQQYGATQQPQHSLIDQMPQSQPAYPYYQPQQQQQQQQQPLAAQGSSYGPGPTSAPPAAPAPAAQQWQVHYTAEGRPYYYCVATGTTQWEAPPGM